MAFRVLVGGAAVLAFPVVNGLAQSVDPALLDAITARDKASISRDVAAIDRYTADDYAAVNPGGVLNNKTQRLAGLKARPNPQAAPGGPAVGEAVRVYGFAAEG